MGHGEFCIQKTDKKMRNSIVIFKTKNTLKILGSKNQRGSRVRKINVGRGFKKAKYTIQIIESKEILLESQFL